MPHRGAGAGLVAADRHRDVSPVAHAALVRARGRLADRARGIWLAARQSAPGQPGAGSNVLPRGRARGSLRDGYRGIRRPGGRAAGRGGSSSGGGGGGGEPALRASSRPCLGVQQQAWPRDQRQAPASGHGGRAAPAPDPVRAAQTTRGLRSLDSNGGQQGRAAEAVSDWPLITIDEAMAELNAMIGLTAVKAQVRSVTASVEAARRRAIAGHGTEKPMQHFVFLGPPGTGKTAVARVIAKIFYAFGLLDSAAVVEAQRADLVGEYLGATAIKTNDLVDSALGGVLFIDEAYSLVNEGDGQGDRFGNEAVQALLKRADDDRENLIIILAGYERQMESFLASNPGLNSRFSIRVKFPSYSPAELMALAEAAVQARGELLDPDARPVLRRLFDEIGRRRLADELGNGRFVRSLLAKAGQQRDVRVMAGPAEPTGTELVTLSGPDVELAYAELTTRFRGYTDTPTVEHALAELDGLVGLEPVKRQVHEIVAQLQVGRLRVRQGLASQPPSRHFVFTGPPGTGKTTVARIIGRIFAALGLLVRPEVIEVHRADLVGEHLGSTAIKTSKLIDSAMGGVLFIDEAYALHNDAYSGGDAFGSEAVATLAEARRGRQGTARRRPGRLHRRHGPVAAQQPRPGLAGSAPGSRSRATPRPSSARSPRSSPRRRGTPSMARPCRYWIRSSPRRWSRAGSIRSGTAGSPDRCSSVPARPATSGSPRTATRRRPPT